MTTRVEIKNLGPDKIRVVRINKESKTADMLGIVEPNTTLETYIWMFNHVLIEEIKE